MNLGVRASKSIISGLIAALRAGTEMPVAKSSACSSLKVFLSSSEFSMNEPIDEPVAGDESVQHEEVTLMESLPSSELWLWEEVGGNGESLGEAWGGEVSHRGR